MSNNPNEIAPRRLVAGFMYKGEKDLTPAWREVAVIEETQTHVFGIDINKDQYRKYIRKQISDVSNVRRVLSARCEDMLATHGISLQ